MPEMKSKIGSVHVYAYGVDGNRDSYTYDEEEFNDGSTDFNAVIDELLEDHTWLKIEVHRES